MLVILKFRTSTPSLFVSKGERPVPLYWPGFARGKMTVE